VFAGEKTDVAVNGYVSNHRGVYLEWRTRSTGFYSSIKQLRTLTPDRPDSPWVALDTLPEDAEVSQFADRLLVSLRTDWRGFAGGALLSASATEVMELGADKAALTALFQPSERVSLSYYTATKNFLVVCTLDNVKTRLVWWKYLEEGGWQAAGEQPEAAIANISLSAVDSDENDQVWVHTSSFLTPSSLALGDAALGPDCLTTTEPLKSLPAMFNAEGLEEIQAEATSADGTVVPYFIIKKKEVVMDGSTPTLLYGYGGFEIPLTPGYQGVTGAAWLERGGCYVTANIRGGGEFGPKWHQAALKANRQRAYDDFIAVAEHLVSTGVTTSARLGIRGGSNGGLLMGNMLVQRPDLFGAVVCAVPLLDMKRFSHLLAGASWMAEYGDPDTADWEFMQQYSPYHNVDAEAAYPALLMTTSTRDDRVHPYHARCFVHRLKQTGNCAALHYYENIEGGHGGAADSKQQAFMTVLYIDFLVKTIGQGVLQ